MKIAIIGCGLIGTKRALAIVNTTDQVTLVYDIDTKKAEELSRLSNAKVAKNSKEIFESDIDLIIIATIHSDLAGLSLEAVTHHKHVLVEKPAGLNTSELEQIITISEKNKVLVKVGFNHRFHPALMQAHQIFQSGEIGKLMYIRARYGHGGRLGYEKEWRCQKDISGGGELIDQGSHLIDLSRWFLGDLELDYSYTPTCFWDIKVDDNCFLALKSKENQMAWLHASWSEWKNCFSFEIYGKVGKLQIEGLGGSYGVEKLFYYKMLPQMGKPETKTWEFDGKDNSWIEEFKEFKAAINEKRQPLGNIYDAHKMHKIIDKIYRR